jgi:hypothetical protein
LTFSGLHGVISQKIVPFIITGVKSSYRKYIEFVTNKNIVFEWNENTFAHISTEHYYVDYKKPTVVILKLRIVA